jgi:hypothetical protein
MFNRPTVMVVEEGEHVVNLNDPNVNLKQEIHLVKDLTQKAMSFQMLFLLPHLLERHIKGKKTLSRLFTITCYNFCKILKDCF